MGVRAQPAGAGGGAAANGSGEGREATVKGGWPSQSQCGGRRGVLPGAELTLLWANRSVAGWRGLLPWCPRPGPVRQRCVPQGEEVGDGGRHVSADIQVGASGGQ